MSPLPEVDEGSISPHNFKSLLDTAPITPLSQKRSVQHAVLSKFEFELINDSESRSQLHFTESSAETASYISTPGLDSVVVSASMPTSSEYVVNSLKNSPASAKLSRDTSSPMRRSNSLGDSAFFTWWKNAETNVDDNTEIRLGMLGIIFDRISRLEVYDHELARKTFTLENLILLAENENAGIRYVVDSCLLCHSSFFLLFNFHLLARDFISFFFYQVVARQNCRSAISSPSWFRQ